MHKRIVLALWDILRFQCPRLFKYGIVFECAFGWYDIIRDLSKKIEKILEEHAERHEALEGEESQYREMYAVQIKEKYGTLRFYMSWETDEISELIRKAEELSAKTCEICGKPGMMRDETWYKVRCDDCYSGEK